MFSIFVLFMSNASLSRVGNCCIFRCKTISQKLIQQRETSGKTEAEGYEARRWSGVRSPTRHHFSDGSLQALQTYFQMLLFFSWYTNCTCSQHLSVRAYRITTYDKHEHTLMGIMVLFLECRPRVVYQRCGCYSTSGAFESSIENASGQR